MSYSAVKVQDLSSNENRDSLQLHAKGEVVNFNVHLDEWKSLNYRRFCLFWFKCLVPRMLSTRLLQGLLKESHPNWVELLTGPLRFGGVGGAVMSLDPTLRGLRSCFLAWKSLKSSTCKHIKVTFICGLFLKFCTLTCNYGINYYAHEVSSCFSSCFYHYSASCCL